MMTIFRRELLAWLARLTGGYFVVSMASPLTRINTAIFSEAQAACAACGTNDCCATQDNCGATDTVGHTCTTKDICDADGSGNCTNDECTSDSSGACNGDRCVSDSSGACTNDGGPAGACTTCDVDFVSSCQGDFSGYCRSDSSGSCTNDTCTSDKSESCNTDSCTSDKSGSCITDACPSDSSGSCRNDTCESDKSGPCTNDSCVSDASGSCDTDSCTADSTGACTTDSCTSDSSGACPNDRCNSDYSGACTTKDVCVLDASLGCDSDLCREDRSPADCTTDTCSLDIAMNPAMGRRRFAKGTINEAIKWLYRLSMIILFISMGYGPSHAATVINATDAVFFPTPVYVTSGSVSVPSPVGPFLRDCDNDTITEADTNGDGQCTGDPEVKDYDSNGTKELPTGTPFTGDFQFTCFYIPSDVAITSTGPLTIRASQEAAVFGAMRLNTGAAISSPAMIDLRTSPWLSEDGSTITFTTAMSGEVDKTQTTYASDSSVPSIVLVHRKMDFTPV